MGKQVKQVGFREVVCTEGEVFNPFKTGQMFLYTIKEKALSGQSGNPEAASFIRKP
ncbi:MAG: hypothetical protein ACYDEQ_09590 [Desulfocucumaceae bacterium]